MNGYLFKHHFNERHINVKLLLSLSIILFVEKEGKFNFKFFYYYNFQRNEDLNKALKEIYERRNSNLGLLHTMAGRGDRKNSAQNSTSLTNHPMLDPVTLHMAYLAAQLRSLQEQNQLASSVFTKSPLSLTDCLSALTNCSVNNLYNAPMGQRLHSFSELTNHLSGRSTTALDAINLATTSIPQTSQQYSTLDMMLQMQMVAATGLMPQTINFLPPASSLSGLLGHPLSCAPNMPGLTPNPASFNNLGLSLASEPPSLNQIAITESSKIDWAQVNILFV